MSVLYEDRQVAIYHDLILIKKYYFPLATSKTILIKEIKYMTLQSS